MNSCTNLFYLSAIACWLAECLPQEELSVLSSDLVVLSDMLANIVTRNDLCKNNIYARITIAPPSNPMYNSLHGSIAQPG